jgi:hypothetical protein
MEFIVEGEPDFLSVSLDKEVFLTKHIGDKVLANGATFTGEVDAVTGDLIHGVLIDKQLNEHYEGPFVNDMRDGEGAISTKLDGSSKFVGSYSNDCFLHGTLITKDFTYTGDFGGGSFTRPIFHGRGLLARSDATVYEGDFQDHRYEGQGVLMNSTRDRYDGRFSNGRKSGLGTMQYQDGSKYSGDWELDLRHGKGAYENSNGTRTYHGEFQYDHPHGNGILVVKDVEMKGSWNQGRPVDGSGWTISYREKGIVYKGDTKCGRPHGQGSLLRLASVTSPQTVLLYTGHFSCGIPTPHTDTEPLIIDDLDESVRNSAADEAMEQLMRSSSSYVDVDCNSKRRNVSDGSGDSRTVIRTEIFCPWIEGIGVALASEVPLNCTATRMRLSRTQGEKSDVVVTLLDESQLLGPLTCNGVMDGPTTFIDALNDSVFTGTFQQGLKHGEGVEQYCDGTVYKGAYKDGWRDGLGDLFDKDGQAIYVGSWLDDKKHGKGVCQYKSPTPYPGSYTGHFKSDQRHGRGTLTTDEGTKYEGDWCHGVPQFGDWVITYPSGSVYLGSAEFMDQFSPPVPMGFGSQREPDGTFFNGNFQNGERHGNGIYLAPDGETYEGRWENGAFINDQIVTVRQAQQFGVISW